MPSKKRWRAPWNLWVDTWRWGPLHLLVLVVSYPQRPELAAGWETHGYVDDGPWIRVGLFYLFVQVGWNPNHKMKRRVNTEVPF